MVTRLYMLGDGFSHQDRADRQAVCQRLGQDHDIGRHAYALVRPQRSGAAEPALDLIKHQQCCVPVAQLTQPVQEFLSCRRNAPLALDRLDHHRAHMVIDHGLGGGEVVKGREAHIRQQRLERLAIFCFVRDRQGAGGTPVKAVLERDDRRFIVTVALSCYLAGELDRAFDGLGARVAQEYPVGEAGFDQQLGQLDAGLAPVQIGNVGQARGLFGDHRADLRIGMAECVDGDTGSKIEIAVAFGVPHLDSAAVLEHKRRAPIGANHVALAVADQLLGVHCSALQPHREPRIPRMNSRLV